MKRSIRCTALGLLLVFLFALVGCGGQQNTETQQSFDAFIEQLGIEEASSNFLSLHYTLEYPERMGITEYETVFPVPSEESRQEDFQDIKETLEQLHTFDRSALTEEQTLLYDILESLLQDNLQWDAFYYYGSPFSIRNGDAASLPYIMNEYILAEKKDVQEYLSLLSSTPALFDGLLSYGKEQAKRGLGSSDEVLQEAADQCASMVKSGEDCILIADFSERLEGLGLTAAEKQDYVEQNRKIVLEQVLPAYQKLGDGLIALKGTGTSDGILCHLENGKRYYELLVRARTGSDRTVEELRTMLQEDVAKNRQDLQALLLADITIADQLLISKPDLSDPMAVLQQLQTAAAEDFPVDTSVEFSVKSVAKSLEDYTSGAFYLVPQMDNWKKNNNVYINQKNAGTTVEQFTVYGHEGFPGHLLQHTRFYSTDPPLLRLFLSYPGYTEGWGQYAQMIAYDYAGDSVSLAKANRAYTNMIIDFYALADIAIHYDGWDTEKLSADFLAQYGIPQSMAEEMYRISIADPAEVLSYQVGNLEFCALRERAKDALGDRFDLKKFHTFLLDIGPAPFEIIDARLDGWINNP